jgi:hypothetical protein
MYVKSVVQVYMHTTVRTGTSEAKDSVLRGVFGYGRDIRICLRVSLVFRGLADIV